MDLDRILNELHAEKQWLETIIGALELAARSPAEQFTARLARGLGDGRSHRRPIYLGQQKKTELARLAGRVQRNSAASKMPPRRSAAGAGILELKRAAGRNMAAA